MIEIKEVKPQKQVQFYGNNYKFDGKLGSHLDQYPFLLNRSQFTIISGMPGAGKSQYLENLFSPKTKLYYQIFSQIFLFVPQASYHPKQSIFRKLKAGNIFHEFTYEKLEKVIDRIEEQIDDDEEPQFSCIIIDDFTSQLKDTGRAMDGSRGNVQTLLQKLIWNKRHLRTSLFMLVQSLVKVPKQLRQSADQLVVFKPNVATKEVLTEEYNQYYDSEQFEAILDHIYKDKYDFMVYRPFTNEMFRNQNKLQIQVIQN